MVKKSVIYTVAALTIFLNLIIPACGNKGSGTNYGANTVCFSGQVCTTGTYGGVPLFGNAPITSYIDNYGSVAQFAIYANNYVSGQTGFSGSVSVTGQVSLVSCPTGAGPTGTYMVVGNNLQFQANYGGSLGLISGTLQSQNGFTVRLYGQIYPTGQGYEYKGNFGNNCDPNAVGL